MEIYQFGKEVGKKVTKFNSNFLLSRITLTENPAHITYMHLEKDGIIGYHQAAVSQLLLVISGEGLVRGKSDEFVKVHSGQAVFWETGEWHETKTDTGLTAMVIESEMLDTSFLVKLQDE